MSAKRVQAAKKRQKFFIKFILLFVVAGSVLFFVRQKKEMLVREGANFLQNIFLHETRLNVHIGKISGRLNGAIRFENVRVEDPALPVGLRLMFRAKEVEVRYRLLDFLMKKFDSKVRVKVEAPELYWRPKVSLRRNRFGFFPWLRDLVLAQRSHLAVSVQDLKMTYGDEAHVFSGIQLDFEDDSFRIQIPVRHWEVWEQDISTQLDIRGKFELGLLQSPDSLTGEISTGGTVINWSPLPWEARFDFKFTNEALEAHSSNFLGGLSVEGGIDFQKDDAMKWKLSAQKYPLTNLKTFLREGGPIELEGSMDLDARLEGPPDAPHLEIYARIAGGHSGHNQFQAMDLHVSGLYPTLELSDSHILLEDGSTMRFADKTVEFKELFSNALYHELISGSDQDTVVMGDWEFKRPTDENQRPEFMMQRTLGDRSSMHIKKFNDPSEETFDSPEKHDVEVGFEYRLKGKDSLKLQMREDEKFVGIERKMSF